METGSRVRQGFTLIELLVVIAVIAILVAILFPVIGSAQEKARQARCMSHMTQISSMLRVYRTDYGRFPFNTYFDATGFDPTGTPPYYGCYQGGASALYPNYVSDKATLRCPNDSSLRSVAPTAGIPNNYSSYNGLITGGADATQATFWGFQSFDAGGGNIGFYCTYNFGGFDDDGWDLSRWSGTGWTYPSMGGATPAWLAAEGKKWRHFPALQNRRAPDNTITFRCVHHHRYYGDTTPAKWRDPVAFLGGDAKTVPWQPWARVDTTTNASQWRAQK